VFWFSRKQKVEQGACLNGDDIIIVHHGKEEFVMKQAEIPLAGAHNVENVLAAVTAARLAGVDTAAIAQAVSQLRGRGTPAGIRRGNRRRALLQRLEATNVDATLKALDAFSRAHPDYSRREGQGQRLHRPAKAAQRKSHSCAADWRGRGQNEKQITSSVAIERAATMDRAVEIAAHAAQPGDIVVLAPACAASTSFRITSTADGSSRSWSTVGRDFDTTFFG